MPSQRANLANKAPKVKAKATVKSATTRSNLKGKGKGKAAAKHQEFVEEIVEEFLNRGGPPTEYPVEEQEVDVDARVAASNPFT